MGDLEDNLTEVLEYLSVQGLEFGLCHLLAKGKTEPVQRNPKPSSRDKTHRLTQGPSHGLAHAIRDLGKQPHPTIEETGEDPVKNLVWL